MMKKVTKSSTEVHVDFKIRLIPKSSKNEIVGKDGDTYRVKVTSPPIDGKANRALISLLSKKLGISKGNIEIVSGVSSRIKRIRVYGILMEDVIGLMDG